MNAAVGEIKKLNESLSQLRQENIVLKVRLVSYFEIWRSSRSPFPSLGSGRYKLLRASKSELRTSEAHWDLGLTYTVRHRSFFWKIEQTSKYFDQEETLRLKRIAAASEKPHDTPSYSSTTVTAVSGFVTLVQTLFLLASPSQICLYRLDPRQRCYQQPTSTRP